MSVLGTLLAVGCAFLLGIRIGFGWPRKPPKP